MAASKSRILKGISITEPIETPQLSSGEVKNSIIAIGASTGGTTAIHKILEQFKSPFPPVLVVQHIPQNFSAAFAKHLNSKFPFRVKEAENGERLVEDTVYIAPGGRQMTVDSVLKLSIKEGELVSGHAPSVDCLFASLKECTQKYKCIAVLLTGMGGDGAHQLLELKNLGVYTIAQDQATIVVYGMPRIAAELGATCTVLPLHNIAKEILCRLKKSSWAA